MQLNSTTPQCRICHVPLDDTNSYLSQRLLHFYICKSCAVERNRQFRKANRVYHCRICRVLLTIENQTSPNYHGRICNTCKDKRDAEVHQKRIEYGREPGPRFRDSENHQKTHLDEIQEKQRAYYAKTKDHRREVNKAYIAELKETTLSKYSGGPPACNRCGFSDIRALSIDHIAGDGCEHRRVDVKGGGFRMYLWLKYRNYPTGYQVLCMNCQFIKRFENKEVGNGLRRDGLPKKQKDSRYRQPISDIASLTQDQRLRHPIP